MKFVLKYYADEILEVNAELTPTHLVLSQGCRNIWDKEQESAKEKVRMFFSFFTTQVDTDTLGKIAETCDGRDSVSKVLSGNKVFFYDISSCIELSF